MVRVPNPTVPLAPSSPSWYPSPSTSTTSAPKTHHVPASHGFAFSVRPGTRFRIVDLHGEQVGTVLTNSQEHVTQQKNSTMRSGHDGLGRRHHLLLLLLLLNTHPPRRTPLHVPHALPPLRRDPLHRRQSLHQRRQALTEAHRRRTSRYAPTTLFPQPLTYIM